MTRTALLTALLIATAGRGEEGRRVALLVGVNDYARTALTDLRGAENDVRDLAGLLRAGGYRVTALTTDADSLGTNGPSSRPTAANVRASFRAVVADLRPGDTFVFAYSGHGVALDSPPRMYLCPADAKLDDRASLVALAEVADALADERLAKVPKVLFLDACRNDPFLSRDAGTPKPDRPKIELIPRNLAVVFSCAEGQRAYECRKRPHGLFFDQLLDGLRGRAANARGEVLYASLVAHVTDAIRDRLREEHGSEALQTPEPLGRLEGPVPLLTRPPEKPGTVTAERVPSPESPAALARLRGVAAFRKGQADRAAAEFAEALRLDPAYVPALLDRAMLSVEQAKPAAALADLNRAVQLDSANATAYAHRGYVHVKRGDVRTALADFTRAVELNPLHETALNNRAYCRVKIGDGPGAVADLTAVLRLNPGNAKALAARAALYLRAAGEGGPQAAQYRAWGEADQRRLRMLTAGP